MHPAASRETAITRRVLIGGVTGAVALAAAGVEPAAAAAAFGRGPRSGMPWHSGCQLNKIPQFEAFRGRLADTYTIWSPRETWAAVTGLNKGGFSVVRTMPGRISFGLAMLPETLHAGRDPSHWVPAARGDFDRYYVSVARQVAESGRKNVIFRIGWESNHDGWPWYGGGDPTRFKQTFRRYARILREHNPTCLIEWCNVKDGSQPYSVLELYPGDAWVDIVGVNHYDGWPAINSDSIWADAYRRTRYGGPRGLGAWLDFARSRNKRFAVSEWGIWLGRPGCTDSAVYIRKMHEFFRGCGADLAYENYFNQIAKHQICPPDLHPRAAAEYRRLWA